MEGRVLTPKRWLACNGLLELSALSDAGWRRGSESPAPGQGCICCGGGCYRSRGARFVLRTEANFSPEHNLGRLLNHATSIFACLQSGEGGQPGVCRGLGNAQGAPARQGEVQPEKRRRAEHCTRKSHGGLRATQLYLLAAPAVKHDSCSVSGRQERRWPAVAESAATGMCTAPQ